ncbi:MAG: putative Ig domain-containing protein [Planctomycetes bacterium]|nr:putative Ig domain-containing protein [Planctomycetota bacterium]
MNHFRSALLCMIVSMSFAGEIVIYADSFTQTAKSEFDAGVLTDVTSADSPGSVKLSGTPVNAWVETSLNNEADYPQLDISGGLAYDSTRNIVIAFPAYSGWIGANQTWQYFPCENGWAVMNPVNPPSRRTGHSMIYDSFNQKVVLFGGKDWSSGLPLADTWIYDTLNNTWTEVTPVDSPSERYAHGMAYDSKNNRIILFGGYDNDVSAFDETWSYDYTQNTWTLLTTTNPPSGRYYFGITYIDSTNEIYIFGGTDENDNDLVETWSFDTSSNVWTNKSPSADPPVSMHEGPIVYYKDAGQIILLNSAQTWGYDLAGNTWVDLSPTPTTAGFSGHGMVYMSALKKTYTIQPGIDNWYEYYTTGYAASGSIESSIYDCNEIVRFTEATWDAVLPPGCNITLQVRASANGTLWDNWSDAAVLSNASGSSINKKARYVQYKAELTTGIASVTPILNSVTIEYEKTLAAFHTSQSDLEDVSDVNVLKNSGEVELAVTGINSVYLVDWANFDAVYRVKWDGLEWQYVMLGYTGADADSIWIGDGDNDGYNEVYSEHEGGAAFQFEFDGTKWVKTSIGPAGGFSWSITGGDADNDGLNEVFVFNWGEGPEIVMFKYVDSYWVKTVIPSTCYAAIDGIIVDADNDGLNELYVQDDVWPGGKIYRYAWNGASWDETIPGDVIRSADETESLGFAVGDGNNNGKKEIYAAVEDTGILKAYQYAWDSGSSSWISDEMGDITAASTSGGSVCIGNMDEDDLNEVYFVGRDNPNINIYQFKWNGSTWDKTLVIFYENTFVSNTLSEIVIKDGDNDGKNEIYGIAGDDNCLIVRYDSGVWSIDKYDWVPANNDWWGLAVGSAYDESSAYKSTGSVTSKVIDSSFSGALWGTIEWIEISPADTDIVLQTRTGNTAIPDETWSGWSSAYTNPAGTAITSPQGQFLQWKAVLSTSNTTKTPILQEVAVKYPVVITTDQLASGIAETAYSETLVVENGTPGYVWTVSAGALPPGLSTASTLDGGLIYGTPTAPGIYNFTLTAEDNEGFASNSKSFTVNVYGITTLILPYIENSGSYNQAITVTGGVTPYTWAIISGSLPDGLALNTVTGVISGTADTPGTFIFTIRATDANLQAFDETYTIDVFGISTVTISGGKTGIAYNTTLQAVSGVGTYAWVITSGTLPAGFSFDSATGNISGTTAVPGNTALTIQVTDANNKAVSENYILKIIGITTDTLPEGTKEIPYSATIETAGGSLPYFYSVTAGALPNGLVLDSLAGKITGTPSNSGVSDFTITVIEINDLSASKGFSIVIQDIPATPEILNITTASLSDGQVGTAYIASLTATGGTAPYTWSITAGGLPDGLILETAGGTLSGIPTLAGQFIFTARATAGNQDYIEKELTITINSGDADLDDNSISADTMSTNPAEMPEENAGKKSKNHTWCFIKRLIKTGNKIQRF